MHLLIRADADSAIGTGHVMRCLALAQAWRARGGRVTFLSRVQAPSLCDRINAGGFAREAPAVADGGAGDADDTRRLAARLGARALVVDGYHFGPDFESRTRVHGTTLLVVEDDTTPRLHSADVILNQNFHAESVEYPCAPATKVLRGPRFALLREEFRPWREWTRAFPHAPRQVLVTLGGADEHNVTLAVMRALARLPWPTTVFRVIAGPANPHVDSLHAAAALHPARFEVVDATPDMPDEMARADLAVTAGGSTCLELAFMGLPSVVITVAANQAATGPAMAGRGAGIDAGWYAALDAGALASTLDALAASPGRRAEMSERGRRLVDGRGAERVVDALWIE